MSGTLEKTWIALAIAGGLFGILLAMGATEESDGYALGTLAGGLLMLVGVAVRLQARAAGDFLVVLGSLPALVMPFWLVIPAIVGVFLIAFGIYDATKATGVVRAT